MADWPAIQDPTFSMFKQWPYRPQVRTQKEANYVQSRVQFSRTRWHFELGWAGLSDTDYNLLVAFFDANQGGTFNWTHWISGTVYVVGFADDQLPEATPVAPSIDGADGYWALSGLILEER